MSRRAACESDRPVGESKPGERCSELRHCTSPVATPPPAPTHAFYLDSHGCIRKMNGIRRSPDGARYDDMWESPLYLQRISVIMAGIGSLKRIRRRAACCKCDFVKSVGAAPKRQQFGNKVDLTATQFAEPRLVALMIFDSSKWRSHAISPVRVASSPACSCHSNCPFLRNAPVHAVLVAQV
jgi:hypothetical protein